MTDHAGFGWARCTVGGLIELHIEHTAMGILSCRDLREELAHQIDAQLAAAADSLVD